MDFKHDLIYSLLAFLWALMLALFAMPSIIEMAHAKKLLDKPNGRTMHTQLTPRLGGVGIFAAFISALSIFGNLQTEDSGVQMLLAGVVILFFIGLKDDIVPVSAFKKFFVQILVASIVVFFGGVRITGLYGFLGVYGLENGASYLITFLVLIGFTNAVNLIDGLDGLAGSIILFISLFFSVCFLLTRSPYVYVAITLSGALLGFLRYNFHHAKIFMGDTGSLLSGFVLAVLGIKCIDLDIPNVNMPAITIAVLVIPVIDTWRVVSLRVMKGRSPFMPDKNHIHHALSSFGLNSRAIVGVLLTFNSLFVGIVYCLGDQFDLTYLVFFMIGLAMLGLFFLTVVSKLKNKK